MLAVYGGHTSVVSLLLEGGIDVNRVTSSGATAFDVALVAGKYEVAEMIAASVTFNVRQAAREEILDEHPLLLHCR